MDFKGGEFVQAFERNFADYIGCKYAVSVSNGTTALEVALAALGIKRGDEVITTPLSFVATGTAILRVGATPVFADIQKNTLNIDPKQIKKAMSPKTKLILPVSLNGMPCDYDEINEIASRADVLVLEDAAQSLGATYRGEKTGVFANMSTFSFQESKTMTTLGEGGMIVTDDPRFYERALNIRNHGNIYGTMTDVVCTNARMTEAQAAFGIMQLHKLDDFNRIQRENAEFFLQHLKLPFKSVYNYPLPKGVRPNYYLMPVLSTWDRDAFLQHMKDVGISQGVPGQNVGYYRKLIPESTVFHRHRRSRETVCPNAGWAKQNVLLFDVHRWNKTKKDMRKYLNLLTC